MFYLLLEFKLNTMKINHFIIKHKLHGMVTRRSGSWVSWRSATSLFFNIFLYFWLDTQKSNTILIKQSLYMNIKFD